MIIALESVYQGLITSKVKQLQIYLFNFKSNYVISNKKVKIYSSMLTYGLSHSDWTELEYRFRSSINIDNNIIGATIIVMHMNTSLVLSPVLQLSCFDIDINFNLSTY